MELEQTSGEFDSCQQSEKTLRDSSIKCAKEAEEAKAKIDDLTKKVDEMNQQMSGKNSEIESLNGQLAELKTQKETLETEMVSTLSLLNVTSSLAQTMPMTTVCIHA
ncbi:uncharacterized protein LOC142338851 isoform X2 [Convolutriloba macropyga]|uniref:uncharacterized protein LOC142338851 isoform X2 n=1 Tax=Convolutriloba macropyga TaxID=536237 RepID=UPI003F524210